MIRHEKSREPQGGIGFAEIHNPAGRADVIGSALIAKNCLWGKGFIGKLQFL